jgi:hypothetical protein
MEIEYDPEYNNHKRLRGPPCDDSDEEKIKPETKSRKTKQGKGRDFTGFYQFSAEKDTELSILDGAAKVLSPVRFKFWARLATTEDTQAICNNLLSKDKVRKQAGLSRATLETSSWFSYNFLCEKINI